jgi:ubiquinone/menaquinone biosynthesis C-methylase UbiE
LERDKDLRVREGLFRHRLIEPEELDHATPEEARPNLADLVRINRRFGGHSVLRNVLKQATPASNARFLDIGAASGDTARVIQQMYPAARITSLDCNATNLEQAPPPKLLGDAFALPFERRSFDYVVCSLFLHHFSNDHVVDLLANFYAVACQGLIVCDLERHILPYLFLPATKPMLGWHRITVQDGLKSVRAAFRANELKELAQRAGIADSRVRVFRPAFRLGLLALR